MLRLLLARYLDADPRELRFELGAHGKPALEGGADLRFNLSPSGELLLVAVATGMEVGVDVEVAPERGRGEIDEPAIAARTYWAARRPNDLRSWTGRSARGEFPAAPGRCARPRSSALVRG